MDTDEEKLNQITERVIGCAFTVCNVLGCGFAEKVYKNSLAHELEKCGLVVEKEKPINVIYDGIVVGEYFADLVVNGLVLVELKSIRSLDERAYGAMPELPRGNRHSSLSAPQLWKTRRSQTIQKQPTSICVHLIFICGKNAFRNLKNGQANRFQRDQSRDANPATRQAAPARLGRGL